MCSGWPSLCFQDLFCSFFSFKTGVLGFVLKNLPSSKLRLFVPHPLPTRRAPATPLRRSSVWKCHLLTGMERRHASSGMAELFVGAPVVQQSKLNESTNVPALGCGMHLFRKKLLLICSISRVLPPRLRTVCVKMRSCLLLMHVCCMYGFVRENKPMITLATIINWLTGYAVK